VIGPNKSAFALEELARLVDGTVIGDGALVIQGAATLTTATGRDISLLDDQEKSHLLQRTEAAAVVVPRNFLPSGCPAIQVDNVHAAFARIVQNFRPSRSTKRTGVSPAAIVSPTARVGEDVTIHAGANIADDCIVGDGCTIHAGVTLLEGCRIGEQTTIFPNCVFYEDTIVGERCIIHANVTLGAYGFGYDSNSGKHLLSAQLGNVVLGDDVDVGAGTTIDRGTYGSTIIGDGTKIDNQVMIAHNCRIGKHNMICSQVGIAGSTSTGDYVVMAGQVGVRDHVHIGDQAILGARAGIMNDVPAGEFYIGTPATPAREQKLKQAAMMKLPEMRKQLKAIHRKITELTEEAEASRPAA